MAGINIKNLTNTTNVSDNDYIIVEQNTGTKKAKVADITKSATSVYYSENNDVIELQKPQAVEKINKLETDLQTVSSQLEQNKNELKSLTSNFRILIASDLHTYAFENIQNYSSRQRTSKLIEAITYEKNKFGLDFAILNGDICNNDATYPTTDRMKNWANEFLTKIPVQTYFNHASHDNYTDLEWFNLFGYHKNTSVSFNEFGFIMLDNYEDNINTVVNSGFGYTGINKEKLIEKLNEMNDKKYIILFCHYITDDTVPKDVKDIINNDERILCVFRSHTHTRETTLIGNKKLYQTGHFSVASGGSWENGNPWCYRIIEMSNGILSTYFVNAQVQYSSFTQNYEQFGREVILDLGLNSSYTDINAISKVEPYNDIDDRFFYYKPNWNQSNLIQATSTSIPFLTTTKTGKLFSTNGAVLTYISQPGFNLINYRYTIMCLSAVTTRQKVTLELYINGTLFDSHINYLNNMGIQDRNLYTFTKVLKLSYGDTIEFKIKADTADIFTIFYGTQSMEIVKIG